MSSQEVVSQKIEQNKKQLETLDVQTAMTRSEYKHMRALQELVLEVLLVVDELCKKYNITYYLGEGTLLGAIRHNGYIPWDDDVDILMKREDYNRFLELAKTQLPNGYVLESTETNPRHWTIPAHVQMTRDVPYKKKRHENVALHNGPNVDILPLDYVPEENSKELYLRGRKTAFLRRVLWIKSGLHNRAWYNTFKKRIKRFYPCKLFGLFFSFDQLHAKIHKEMTMTYDTSCGYLACFGSLYNITVETFPKEWYGEPEYIDFEGYRLPVPAQSHKILNRIYGDYLALPPVEKRLSKHFFEYDGIEEEQEGDSASEQNDNGTNDTDEAVVEALNQTEELMEQSFVIRLRRRLGRHKRRILRKARRVYRALRASRRSKLIVKYNKLPIDDKTVLYDTFSGLGILDSPRAIFKRLLERSEFEDYVHVWTVKDKALSKPNLMEFENMPNVKFVKRNSKDYIKYLSLSKYVISNSSIPKYYARRNGQVYLNTWHGVPLKAMGYERPGQRVNSTENVVRNYLNATHIIGANHFTAKRMFKQAYMLDGIYNGTIVDEPMPRTDMVQTTNRADIKSKLSKLGIDTGKKMIVYAPTWKGSLFNNVCNDIDDLKATVLDLQQRIDTNTYKVYLRVHYFLYRAIQMDKELKNICIPFTIDTDELLSVTDILISDYSSIFFDFLATRRPILFYVPDIEEYSENRGIYISTDELPGPVTKDMEELADFINNIDQVHKTSEQKYLCMYSWCSHKEDGNVSDRVIDTVFLGQQGDHVNCSNDKKKVLFMADWNRGFSNQTQLIELFNLIDYDKYDVTLMTTNPKKEFFAESLEMLNPHVRILTNYKTIIAPYLRRKKIYALIRQGEILLEEACKQLNMDYNWRRLVGESSFDVCIQLPPEVSHENWMLLGFYAPIKKKIFIDNYTVKPMMYDEYRYQDVFLDSLEGVLEELLLP